MDSGALVTPQWNIKCSNKSGYFGNNFLLCLILNSIYINYHLSYLFKHKQAHLHTRICMCKAHCSFMTNYTNWKQSKHLEGGVVPSPLEMAEESSGGEERVG